ncbi:hypothetical protein NKI56_34330, partial [Mesorhizobium sp. M0622]|uniref:hypothetical protein n=1 Tax=Mesorhizobium sp. M0622 TaxID=2956975 RepID=UPI0033367AC2
WAFAAAAEASNSAAPDTMPVSCIFRSHFIVSESGGMSPIASRPKWDGPKSLPAISLAHTEAAKRSPFTQ